MWVCVSISPNLFCLYLKSSRPLPLLKIPFWPFCSPTHPPLVILSLAAHPWGCQNLQWSFSCSLRANRLSTSQTLLSPVSCHLLKRHIPGRHYCSKDKYDRGMLWRDGQEWTDSRRKMTIMHGRRGRSGRWVEVKRKRKRIGECKKKNRIMRWDERWSVRWRRRSGDINYKERLDSCQEQIALLGKGGIFQPLVFCHFVFSSLVNLLYWRRVLFSE